MSALPLTKHHGSHVGVEVFNTGPVEHLKAASADGAEFHLGCEPRPGRGGGCDRLPEVGEEILQYPNLGLAPCPQTIMCVLSSRQNLMGKQTLTLQKGWVATTLGDDLSYDFGITER